MEGGRRFRPRRECEDRHLVRDQRRGARRRRRLDAGSGAKLLAYTKSIGGEIAAAKLFNEPTIPAAGGASPGYDAAAFARDIAVFRPFAKQAAPAMLIVGPGSAGEGTRIVPASFPMLTSEALLSADPRPVFDVFSYHYYGAVSLRCAQMGKEMLTTPEAALSEEWLSRSDKVHAFHEPLRDRFEPGKPMWVTETADAACGRSSLSAWRSGFASSTFARFSTRPPRSPSWASSTTGDRRTARAPGFDTADRACVRKSGSIAPGRGQKG